MDETFEVLSALLDGDAVDLQDLESAINTPHGRSALIAFVRLRQAVNEDQARPRPAFYSRAEQARSLPGRALRYRVPLPFAAAAVLAAVLIGSLVRPDVLDPPERGVPNPPPATRVLTFEVGVDWHPAREAR